MNQGVGAAFAAMLDYCRLHGKTHFVFQEGSYKVRAQEIVKIIRIAEEGDYDYILGSRFLDPGNAAQTPWQRRALIRPFSTLFRWLTGFSVTDITCGPRLVKMAAWNNRLNTMSQHFGYQFEHIITIWLLHHGARYKPVAVEIQYPELRNYSYINFGNIWQMERDERPDLATVCEKQPGRTLAGLQSHRTIARCHRHFGHRSHRGDWDTTAGDGQHPAAEVFRRARRRR